MTTLSVDGAGWLGAAALLLAYGLVSAGRLNGRSAGFQLLNLGGAAGLLVNGAHHGAWPSAVLNAVWVAVGVVALVRLARSRPAPSPGDLRARAGAEPATDLTG